MNRSRFPRFFFSCFLFSLLSFHWLSSSWHFGTIFWFAVIHVSVINCWQALGLFALSRILFGGFPGKPGWAGHGRRRHEMEAMRNKWFNLSPEEKSQFKQELEKPF